MLFMAQIRLAIVQWWIRSAGSRHSPLQGRRRALEAPLRAPKRTQPTPLPPPLPVARWLREPALVRHPLCERWLRGF